MATKWPAMIGLVATLVVSGAIPAAAQGNTPASGRVVAAEQEPPEPSPEPGPNPNPTPPDVQDFQLKPSAYNSNFDNPAPGSFPDRVAKLDSELPRTGVQRLLDEAGRPATFGADCSSPAFKDMEPPPPQRWCFDPADTSKPDAPNLEWVPQGVTTVADAQEDQSWGDKKALLVSWYDKAGTGAEKGVRISFLNPETKKYQHVLLVYPYLNSNDNPSYEIVSSPQSGNHAGIHAGGILWYGNYLYVVDTNRGIRAFDMRQIFDLKSAGNGDTEDRTKVGRHDNKYYAFGYRYVMPQVASWEDPGGLATFPPNYACSGEGTPKYSFISLDRSGADKLITGEYCSKGAIPDTYGRVAQWPLNSGTGLPALRGDGNWHADRAYRLPVPNVQGAVSYDGRWYLSKTGGGPDGNATLVEAESADPDAGVLTVKDQRRAAIGTEDLSYWPGRNEIWTVTEHPGKRVLYGVPR